jgi:hypothetical protein
MILKVIYVLGPKNVQAVQILITTVFWNPVLY